MIIKEAVKVLKTEAASILDLTEKIGPDFEKMVNIICSSTGRVIVAGIGKSGLIGRKIVATLTSTGTNAMFLHPVEAMHGDLGMVSKNDVLIAISNSGETDELNIFLPSIKALGCKMIAFTGNIDSTMAKICGIIIDTGVKKEACPLGLAPTSSTTAQLAMGDALAVVLIHKKKFQKKDFKKSHPGGALGQRLSGMVGEIMLTGSAIPHVPMDSSMEQAIDAMEKSRLGVVLILNKEKILAGIITDGDVRHFIAKKPGTFKEISATRIMTENPRTISQDSPLYDALNIMEKHQITVLPVTDKENRIEGVLHLHDILGKGAFKFNGA
ncbi:MAG: KpsF/GutQ family sugar-phosphate isomerase [Thermodesulfobacteriota bacterium]|nr:KpsF/GutQ family sugar-phosphate isomerase [Thermodesulfobacteriota bacterium]